MPNWLTSTIVTLPSILWVIVGMGVSWALVILPRRDWRSKPMIAALALAFGPALLTAWMFIVGTLGQNSTIDGMTQAGDPLNPMQTAYLSLRGGENLLRPDLILIGTAVIAALGWVLAWHKLRTTTPADIEPDPLAPDELILITMIGLATFGRWWITSWVSFGAWDPLWVYAYQGRMYTLLGYIPTDIGYYPQFLPLQYAYAQIVNFGAINDHAARAILPFLHFGSVLTVYVLGMRLFTRRAGIFAAAIWALYPHFGYWTRVGDLEIPLTFGFTGAAAFFLAAWIDVDRGLRRRYALIAGLFFGIAMWTKPTAGAFIWGVVLVVALDFLRVRFDWRRWLPRFEVAVITGLACLPLGAAWYVRNILIGHDAIMLPPSVWLTRAMRSGQEFGWPALALITLLLYLYFSPGRHRPDQRGVLIGLGFLALALTRTLLDPARMIWWEWLAFGVGVLVLEGVLGDYAFAHTSNRGKRDLGVIGWSSALALPYFVTWFFSYSYHYRLSFAIVPLMILPTAVILSRWFTTAVVYSWPFRRRVTYAGVVIALSLPGVAIAIYDEGAGWDWLWTLPAEEDYSDAALFGVVDFFREYDETHEENPVIVAPGMQTLPFFFPTWDIRTTAAPMTLHDMDGITYFILANPEATVFYQQIGIHPDFVGQRVPYQSQWFSSLFRENVVQERIIFEDSGYSYAIYTVDTSQRFEPPPPSLISLEEEVIFGEAIRFIGYSYSDTTLKFAPEVTDLHMIFEVLAPIPDDYMIYIHLIDPANPDVPIATADGPVRQSYYSPEYYSTQFWELGEYVIDRRIFYYENAPVHGEGYMLRIGFYSIADGHRLPVTINGTPAGDGYLWETEFTIPEG